MGNIYYKSTKYGLNGVIAVEKRWMALSPLVDVCKNATILDIGCAEGILGRYLLQRGAQLVHGVDISNDRILAAKARFINDPMFMVCFDVSNFEKFESLDFILDSYDIVLFLGVYHHIMEKVRDVVLSGLLKKCSKYFAFRTSIPEPGKKWANAIIEKAGFKKYKGFVWKRNS